MPLMIRLNHNLRTVESYQGVRVMPGVGVGRAQSATEANGRR